MVSVQTDKITSGCVMKAEEYDKILIGQLFECDWYWHSPLQYLN